MLSFTSKGNNPIYVIQSLFNGIKLLGHKELRKFLWIPILINLFLYTSAFLIAYLYMLDLITELIPAWLQWLSWLLIPLFFISCFTIMFFSFTILANIIAAPFYSKLAEKTLYLITKPEHQAALNIPEIPWSKSMASEFNRIIYLLKWIIPLVILSIIPGINILAPIAWLIFGSWGVSLEFLTYPLENQGLVFSEQKKLIKSVRFGALTIGGLTMLGLTLPGLNIFLSPAAVIAATVYTHGISETT